MKSSLANLLDGVSREFLASMRSSTNLSRDRCKYVPVSSPPDFLSVRVPEQVAESPRLLPRFTFRVVEKNFLVFFLAALLSACVEKAPETRDVIATPAKLE